MANLFSGMFDGPKQYGFTSGDINSQIAKQQGNINDFSNQLASMRSQYLAQIPGLNQAAFSQFGANAQGQMGANGLTPNSGAFADALARQAIPMQANMINTGYQTGVGNANSVMSANTSLNNAAMGVMGQGLSGPTAGPLQPLLGGMIGAGASALMGPMAGMAANSLFAGNGGNYVSGAANPGWFQQGNTNYNIPMQSWSEQPMGGGQGNNSMLYGR